MKKLVIAIVVLGVLGGGGFSVLKWMKIGPFAVSESDSNKMKESIPSFYTDMDPLIIPVFQGERVALTYQIQFKIETLGKKNQALVQKMMPRLHDAFLRDLYIYIPRILKKKNKLDYFIIKDRLKRIGDREAGAGVINNILIQSVIDKAG